jgi:cell division protein FtsA
MQDNARYAVGIDIGTTTVRCVVGHIDTSTGIPTIVGIGEASSTGMRKGTIANLQGPADAIDTALGEAERMSGFEVDEATLSVNGAHILSTKADGMIAVGAMDHEISQQDLGRVEEVATIGKVPPNREILEVVPFSYRLDGQENIKDPLGMTGTRLEITANVVSALTPNMENLRRAAESAKVVPHSVVASVLAAAKAVLSESQLESGVAVVDMGGATTSVAIFEEGDLQHVGVIPIGGIQVTNDLAIGLKTDPDVAEDVKKKHASATPRSENEGVSVKQGDDVVSFQTEDIDEIVLARLEEIFEAVQDELKRAGRAGQLPSGVVLTGGAANLSGMTSFVRDALGVAARIGKPSGFSGVDDRVMSPQYACAVGLMFVDMDETRRTNVRSKSAIHSGTTPSVKPLFQAVQNVFKKFKS